MFWNALLSAACVVLFVTECLADGFSAPAAPALSRSLNCYGKVYGAGDFSADRMTVAGVTVDSLASNDLGVGVQLGCDVASSTWLAGLFADYTWRTGAINVTAPIGTLMNQPFRGEGSIGFRVGVLPTSRSLIYGLVAYELASSDNVSMMGVPLNLSGPRGVAVGGGIEIGLTTNVTASLEYRHIGFDTQSSAIIPSRFDVTENQVRAGIGYHF
jgi:opacity protein-like surface antigen